MIREVEVVEDNKRIKLLMAPPFSDDYETLIWDDEGNLFELSLRKIKELDAGKVQKAI